jgi:ribosomal protein S18 acetylase RimI-like enzyme
VAAQLLSQLVEFTASSGFQHIELEVDLQNNAALRFYQKHGFSQLAATAASAILQLGI